MAAVEEKLSQGIPCDEDGRPDDSLRDFIVLIVKHERITSDLVRGVAAGFEFLIRQSGGRAGFDGFWVEGKDGVVTVHNPKADWASAFVGALRLAVTQSCKT